MFLKTKTKPDKFYPRKIRIVFSGLVLFFCLTFFLNSSVLAMELGLKKKKKKDTVISGKVVEQISPVLVRPVSGASIKVLESSSAREVASDISLIDGSYKITTQLDGSYNIKASAENYTEQVQTNIRLKKDKSYPLDFNLCLLQNHPPEIIFSIPSFQSICTTENDLYLSINAVDKDKDPLMYRYLIDEKIIRDWSNSSSYSFRPLFSDRGRHRVKIEVKDDRDGKNSLSVDIYIVKGFPNPPG